MFGMLDMLQLCTALWGPNSSLASLPFQWFFASLYPDVDYLLWWCTSPNLMRVHWEPLWMWWWRMGGSTETFVNHISHRKKPSLLPGPAVVMVCAGAAFLQNVVCQGVQSHPGWQRVGICWRSEAWQSHRVAHNSDAFQISLPLPRVTGPS